MYKVALKMLFNDRAKFLTLLIGLSFSVLLIAQQGSIFCGLMLRTGSTIFDTNVPIWVMDAQVASINDIVPLSDSRLLEVRSVEGVEWAVPMLMRNLTAQAFNGKTANLQLIGVDDESLVGIPTGVVAGDVKNVNQPEAIIVSTSRKERFGDPGVNGRLELNNRHAKVVAIVKGTQNFTPFPTAYTTYSNALNFLPPQEKNLSFVLVKPKPGYSEQQVIANIERTTGLMALPQMDFFWRNMAYWAKNTGIPINFGITIALGVLVGAAIAGQTLYTFVLENTRQFGTFKAIGIQNRTLVGMVLLQSLTVGVLGYGIGVGITSLVGYLVGNDAQLAFYTPWQLYVIAFVVVVGFCALASVISIQRVLRLDPAIVFRG